MAPRGAGRWADNRRVRAHADHPSYAFPILSYKTEIRSNAATGLRAEGGACAPRYPLPTHRTQRAWGFTTRTFRHARVAEER